MQTIFKKVLAVLMLCGLADHLAVGEILQGMKGRVEVSSRSISMPAKSSITTLLILLSLPILAACYQASTSIPASKPTKTPETPPESSLPKLVAGFRYSTYGAGTDLSPEYWASVGQHM